MPSCVTCVVRTVFYQIFSDILKTLSHIRLQTFRFGENP